MLEDGQFYPPKTMTAAKAVRSAVRSVQQRVKRTMLGFS